MLVEGGRGVGVDVTSPDSAPPNRLWSVHLGAVVPVEPIGLIFLAVGFTEAVGIVSTIFRFGMLEIFRTLRDASDLP